MPIRALIAPLLAVVAAAPVHAEPPAAAPDARMHYDGYAMGLNLFAIDLTVALRPTSYRMKLSFRLVGMADLLFHANGSTVVDGRFDGPRARPRELFSAGQFGGEQHVMQLDWVGDAPMVTQMKPPPETDREPVPASEQSGTVDTFSAIAMLLHRVGESGTCESTARTFDGERLTEFAAQTTGVEMLASTARSSFQGRALRCDVTGRMIGGFMRDADRAELSKPKHASVWFARLAPDQPEVPVRIVFYAKDSPSAMIYLKEPAAASD
jgi:hypothetical protein